MNLDAKKKVGSALESSKVLNQILEDMYKGRGTYTDFLELGKKANEIIKDINEINQLMNPDEILASIGASVSKLARHIRSKTAAQGNIYSLNIYRNDTKKFIFLIVCDNNYDVKLQIKTPVEEEHLLIVIKNMIVDKFGVQAKEIYI